MTSSHPSRGRPARPAIAGFPRYALVVPLCAGVGAAVFLAWKPGVALSTLRSPRALGFSMLVAATVLALGWALPRLARRAAATIAAQVALVVVTFAVTVLPAFRDVTVDEAFPVEVRTDGTTSPALPPVAAPAATAEPAALAGRARLHGIDHRASGDVLLLRTRDGLVVRLQSLDVEPGPDYQVHLVAGVGRRSPDGGVHLGKLRANKGNLNYAVPSDVSISQPLTVLIWCRAFAVPVAYATVS